MKHDKTVNLVDEFGDIIKMEPTSYTHNYIYLYVLDTEADETLDLELNGSMAPTFREVAAFLRGEDSKERKVELVDDYKDTFEIEFEMMPRRVYMYFGANEVDFSFDTQHAEIFDEMAEFLEGIAQ